MERSTYARDLVKASVKRTAGEAVAAVILVESQPGNKPQFGRGEVQLLGQVFW